MSQQDQEYRETWLPGFLMGIYRGFEQWVSREIIDFDPWDNEALVAEQLLEQFLNAPSEPELQLAYDSGDR
ncbi:MAG TPA: hypothetical protein V6D19_04900 [Stenomitos sp.]